MVYVGVTIAAVFGTCLGVGICCLAVSTEPVPVPNITALKSRERHVMQSACSANERITFPRFSQHFLDTLDPKPSG